MTRLLWMMLAVAAALAAQVPGMVPWWDSPLARDLNLSDDQQKQIRAVVRESRPRMIQLRAALETAEAELADLMNDDPVDARKTSEAIERTISARGEMGRAASLMSLKLRQVLTLKQWQELQRRQPRPAGPAPRMGPRGGPRRQGPAGPPPD